MVALLRGPGRILNGHARFSGPGGPQDQVAGASCQTAPQHRIERLDAALDVLANVAAGMLDGHQAGKNAHSAANDPKVVVAFSVRPAAQLADLQPAPEDPIVRSPALQADDPVADTVQVHVEDLARLVVREDDGALTAREELLERENLPPVAERILSQQTHLRQRIKHHAYRLDPIDLGEHLLGRLGQLDFRGMEHGVAGVRPEALLAGRDLDNVNSLQPPAVRTPGRPQLLLALRERHEQAPLP